MISVFGKGTKHINLPCRLPNFCHPFVQRFLWKSMLEVSKPGMNPGMNPRSRFTDSASESPFVSTPVSYLSKVCLWLVIKPLSFSLFRLFQVYMISYAWLNPCPPFVPFLFSHQDQDQGGETGEQWPQGDPPEEEEDPEAGHSEEEGHEEAHTLPEERRRLPVLTAGQPEQQLPHHGPQSGQAAHHHRHPQMGQIQQGVQADHEANAKPQVSDLRKRLQIISSPPQHSFILLNELAHPSNPKYPSPQTLLCFIYSIYYIFLCVFSDQRFFFFFFLVSFQVCAVY